MVGEQFCPSSVYGGSTPKGGWGASLLRRYKVIGVFERLLRTRCAPPHRLRKSYGTSPVNGGKKE